MLPSVSVVGLLGWVALAAIGSAVAAGAMQGYRLALALTVSLGLLGVVFAGYAVAFLLAWAAALVVARREFREPGPFRPAQPQEPLPRDLAGEER